MAGREKRNTTTGCIKELTTWLKHRHYQHAHRFILSGNSSAKQPTINNNSPLINKEATHQPICQSGNYKLLDFLRNK